MPLGQVGDTHPRGNAFNGELDTLQHSSLALIALHNFSPDFGEFLFGSDYHRIANWCSQESSAPSCLSWWRGTESFKDVGAKARLTLPTLGIFFEQGACR
jgi:hypothetical protein